MRSGGDDRNAAFAPAIAVSRFRDACTPVVGPHGASREAAASVIDSATTVVIMSVRKRHRFGPGETAELAGPGFGVRSIGEKRGEISCR
jgi:hypothetical protein